MEERRVRRRPAAGGRAGRARRRAGTEPHRGTAAQARTDQAGRRAWARRRRREPSGGAMEGRGSDGAGSRGRAREGGGGVGWRRGGRGLQQWRRGATGLGVAAGDEGEAPGSARVEEEEHGAAGSGGGGRRRGLQQWRTGAAGSGVVAGDEGEAPGSARGRRRSTGRRQGRVEGSGGRDEEVGDLGLPEMR